MEFKELKIGKLKIFPPLILAPMAGLTHTALRQLILDFGGCGMLSTEMLSAARLQNEDPALSPYLITTNREHPISYQFLIYNKDHIPKAVEKATQLGADAIDINLGCGAPKVRKKGGGIGLVYDSKRLAEIVAELKKTTHLPITAKIRLGQRDDQYTKILIERCLFLESIGIDCIYIHARFEREPFSRAPRWDIVASLNGLLKIPYVINGGVFSIEDAQKALMQSKAHGLMIGRGAAIRPWLFAEIATSRRIRPRLSEVFFKFVQYLTLFPEKRRLGRLKEFTHYFSKNFAFGNRFAMDIQHSETMDEAITKARDFFTKTQKELELPSMI